jgi:hypothetical protein
VDTTADRPLGDLLGDVRGLRLTLAADLTTAAAAAELGSGQTVADILDGDRRELAAFRRRATERLHALDKQAPTVAAGQPRWRRRALITLPAIPLAGALAMSAAAAMGALPDQHSASRPPHVLSKQAPPVTTTFEQFANVVSGDPSASQLVAAATALHRQIAAMIAGAPTDPSGVREVVQLLQMEQALLLRKLPPGSNIVLAQSRRLAARLLSVTESVRTPSAQPVPTSSAHTTAPRTTSKSDATPKPSATHTSTPSPQPTVTPTSSPSSSDSSGHLPTIGN